MSDTIVVMADGVVQQIGTPKGIYDEPANAFVADFIGESNIIIGTVVAPRKVRFCGKDFACVDDFEVNEKVDVVVRPEDIEMCAPEDGMLKGKVISVVFKGIHYEITVQVGKFEFVIQSTQSRCVGDLIGMNIAPDAIHLMAQRHTTNIFDGVITKRNTVEFAEGEFECDVTQLYPGSHLDEEEYLITKEGEKLDLTGTEVRVEVSPCRRHHLGRRECGRHDGPHHLDDLQGRPLPPHRQNARRGGRLRPRDPRSLERERLRFRRHPQR